MKKILMCLLMLMCLCACGKENKIRNNTSGLYKLISKEKEIKEVLSKNVFEIEGPSSLKGYIFKEDGTFIEDYYGDYPDEYFRVGALNDIEKVGEWKIEEETTVLISCDGVNLHYKLYEFEKEYTLIPADWDPDYEGKYASLYEDDKEYFYDNTPYSVAFASKNSDAYLFDTPKGAAIKNELVGVWVNNKEDLYFSNVILFKSNGQMAFSANLAGTTVTHYGRWAELNGKIYISGFDEYSGNDFDDMTPSIMWHEFEYELKDGKLISPRLFYEFEYEYYGGEDSSNI